MKTQGFWKLKVMSLKPAFIQGGIFKTGKTMPGVVVHTCHPSAQEGEAGSSL